MARTGRLFAQIDVNYFEDDRVLNAGEASVIHLAAIFASKRNLTDGCITRRQLARVAPDWISDISPMIDTLIRVGLFIDRGDTLEVRGWSNWNMPASDIEVMSKGGKLGNHVRHHANKGKWGKTCEICSEQKGRGLLAPESPPDRPPSPRAETETETETDSQLENPGDVDPGRCLSDLDREKEKRASAELDVPVCTPGEKRMILTAIKGGVGHRL